MIPDELKIFFKDKGRILLIKGNAGTGKTLLGFKLLKEMNEVGDVIWVNSRDMDSADIKELSEIIPNKKRMNASTSKSVLDSVSSNDDRKIPTHVPSKFEVIEALYEEVKGIDSPTVVVDSFEGLTTDLDENEKENLRIKLVRLARDTKTNIAVIMETFEPNQLDYLADGVITLNQQIIDDSRIREIQLNKLRGTEIKMPTYLFSLYEGNFRYFPPFGFERVKKPIIPTPIQDYDDMISSGINDFDVILGGGYKKGGVNFFEIDTTIGNHYEKLFIPTIINHINQKRGFIYIPPAGKTTLNLIESLSPYISKGLIDNYISSIEHSSDKSGYDFEHFVAEGLSLEEDIAPMIVERNKYHEKGPVLIVIGMDTLEYTYGIENAHSVIVKILSSTRIYKDVAILLGTDDQIISNRIAHIVDTHWKMKLVHDSLTIYGLIPRTEFYCITTDATKGFIEPKLTPIV